MQENIATIRCHSVAGHHIRFQKSTAEPRRPFVHTSRFLRLSFLVLIASILITSCGGGGGAAGGYKGPGLLGIAVSHTGTGTITAGSDLIYNIVVTNTGGGASIGETDVTATLASGMIVVSNSGAGWSCSPAGAIAENNGNRPVEVCTHPVPIDAGASSNFTLTAFVPANALGQLIVYFGVSGVEVNAHAGANYDIAVVNGYAGSNSGNELVLNGQYAILMRGFNGSGTGSPVAMVGTFTADGQGHITGGQVYLNNSAIPIPSGASLDLGINQSGSLYTVGPDNRACLQLGYSGSLPITAALFRLALGGIGGGVASKGDIIEFDDSSGTGAGTRITGVLRQENPTTLTTTAPQSNLALGVSGLDFAGRRFSLAGNLNVATGNLPYDSEEGGVTATNCLGTIPYSSLLTFSQTTAQKLNINPGCGYPDPAYLAFYVVNTNEIFCIQINLFASGQVFGGGSAIFSGRAIATGNSFSSGSLSGNYVLHMTGQTGGAAYVSLGLLTLTPGGGATGSVAGTLFSYSRSSGASTTAVTSGSYTVDPVSGRVTFSGSGVNGIVAYATTPFDGISAFVLGEPDDVSGAMEFQPSQTYTTAGIAGTYILGTEDPGDNTVNLQSGVATLSSAGIISGTEDQSGLGGLQPNQAILGIGPVSINSAGIGNVGPNTVAITNGTKLFFIDESGGSAVIKVLEK